MRPPLRDNRAGSTEPDHQPINVGLEEEGFEIPWVAV